SAVAGAGPVLLPRTGAGGGCQAAGNECSSSAGCSMSGPCGTYADPARAPVGLSAPRTPAGDRPSFTGREAAVLPDLNGDGDLTDTVVTFRDRTTGADLAIGQAGNEARAVAEISQPPFAFPALAVEGDVLAFLEPEIHQGVCSAAPYCDENGDG